MTDLIHWLKLSPKATDLDILIACYKCLEIPLGCDYSTIRSAWRKKSFKFHPDKQSSDKTESATHDFHMFGALLQFILSNLDYHVIDDHVEPDDIFAQQKDNLRSVFNFEGVRHAARLGDLSSPQNLSSKHPIGYGPEEEIKIKLDITLEEYIHGCTKEVTYGKFILEENCHGKISELVREKVIVPPCLRKTTINLFRKGHENALCPPSDVVIKLNVLPHPVFSIEGDDLVATREFKLTKAIGGLCFDIADIYDGPPIHVDLRHLPITRDYRHVIPNMGFRKDRRGNRHGNLIVKIKIQAVLSNDDRNNSIIKCFLG